MRSFRSQRCSSQVRCQQHLCFSPQLKTKSNFPTTVPFVIVLSFPGLIVKLTSNFQDWIVFVFFRKENGNITLSSSPAMVRF